MEWALFTLNLKNKGMLLFFDTETTGIPRNWKAPVTDTSNWPRMVQIAWILYDHEGNLIEEGNHIIKPDGYVIPVASSRIHGITTEQAMLKGEELRSVLQQFSGLLPKVDYLVAHNLSFDEKILGAELIRMSMPTKLLFSKSRICTMETTTEFCAIPGNYGYKWPKLSELHYKLFGTGFAEAHNAAVDIQATARCFWELRRRGLF